MYENQKRYLKTKKGKEAVRRYQLSEKGRQAYRRATKKCVGEKKDFIDNFKRESGCVECGFTEPVYCLDLHHVEPRKTKTKQWSMMNWEVLLEELEKSIVLCKNCHAIVHEGNPWKD